MITYKEALTYISPNMEQDDPIKSFWVLRLGSNGIGGSVQGSRRSALSRSPSSLSVRSLSQISPYYNSNGDMKERSNMAPSIKKLLPKDDKVSDEAPATAEKPKKKTVTIAPQTI